MTDKSRVASVRQLVQRILLRRGAKDPLHFREILLLRDGLYCGRRFVREDTEIVWFDEEAELKIYGPGQQVERLLLNEDGVVADRRAAA